MTPTFEELASEARAAGDAEVVERVWESGQIVDEHRRPFVAHALVVAGEMWLTVDGETRHLVPGDRFELADDHARGAVRRRGRDVLGQATLIGGGARLTRPRHLAARAR